MKRVTGLGGVFFKANDPEKITAWYERHLGLPRDESGVQFRWRGAEDPNEEGATAWAPFPRDSPYFTHPFMINYRVDDLDALLVELQKEGVQIDPKRDDSEYGRFAWIVDPEGNRVELWEPPKKK